MLHNFEPTLNAPHENSQSWYKNYHNSFYMCQLVNNVLLSYLRSFIEFNEKKNIMNLDRDFLLEKGALKPSESLDIDIRNDEKVYSIAIESFIAEISSEFSRTANRLNDGLFFGGIDAGDYFDKDVKIDLKELSESVSTDDWFQIVKGFLNVWEFIFLFGIIESTLKQILGKKARYTSDLIVDLDKEFPTLLSIMKDEHRVSNCLSKNLWTLYTSLRNIYAHSHGVISEKNKRRITKEVKAFRKSYNISFHEINEVDDLILSSLMKESGELFNGAKIQVGKFYLIEDTELNIFRNFSSKILVELNKVFLNNS